MYWKHGVLYGIITVLINEATPVQTRLLYKMHFNEFACVISHYIIWLVFICILHVTLASSIEHYTAGVFLNFPRVMKVYVCIPFLIYAFSNQHDDIKKEQYTSDMLWRKFQLILIGKTIICIWKGFYCLFVFFSNIAAPYIAFLWRHQLRVPEPLTQQLINEYLNDAKWIVATNICIWLILQSFKDTTSNLVSYDI